MLLLISGVLSQMSVSSAQANGTELAENVSAEVSGPEASVALVDVSAFPPEGEAIFEPGTPYEEQFTYESVDENTNKLLGVTRPSPMYHASGVFVQAPDVAPTPTPSPPTSPAPERQSSSDETAAPDNSSTSGGSDTDVSSDASPQAGSVDDGVTELLSDSGCTDDPVCSQVGESLSDPIGKIGLSGTCDVETGEACPVAPCPPYLQYFDPNFLECSTELEDVLSEALPTVETPDGPEVDPAVPWPPMVIDPGAPVLAVDDLVPDAPSAEELVEVGLNLVPGHCKPSAEAPYRSEGGTMVRATGSGDCDEDVLRISILVQIQVKDGAVWEEQGVDWKFKSDASHIEKTNKRTACRPGTWKYRTAVILEWTAYSGEQGMKSKITDPVEIFCGQNETF